MLRLKRSDVGIMLASLRVLITLTFLVDELSKTLGLSIQQNETATEVNQGQATAVL